MTFRPATVSEVRKFFSNMTTREFMLEWVGKDLPDSQKLTEEDKTQIMTGIGNGSLTY